MYKNYRISFALAVTLSLYLSLPAYDLSIENKTERILEARGHLVAAIGNRKHTDWKTIMPGESASFKTSARLIKGAQVRFPTDNTMKKYNYPSIEKYLLEESASTGMADSDYMITSIVTPQKGGASETFYLFRMPKIPLRPGGIVNESKSLYFASTNPASNQQSVNQFNRYEGSNTTNYDQAYYVMAHNAHTSLKYGYKIDPQQDATITELLKVGVRGFMLDTYLDKDTIVLKHGGDWNPVLKLGGKPDSLKGKVEEIVASMKTFPNVIVTIIFEDYVGEKVKIFDKLLSSFSSYIFTPDDYNKLNKWPTLDWMRKQNKRLILFKNTSDHSQYIFAGEWRFHIENQYSVTDMKKCATERSESKIYGRTTRNLFVFNYFGKFNDLSYGATQKGYKSSLNEALNYAFMYGLDGKYKGKKPNFLATDFSEWGSALDIVHDWNLPHKTIKK